jgi:hypothetical protein
MHHYLKETGSTLRLLMQLKYMRVQDWPLLLA